MHLSHISIFSLPLTSNSHTFEELVTSELGVAQTCIYLLQQQ